MTLANLTTTPVDETFLTEITNKTLDTIHRKGDIGVVLVGAGRMQALNRRYRRKNRVTDVLAFPYRENADNELPFPAADDSELLGEVVICLPVAKKQAKRAGYSFKHELATLLVHGILHVCGYDHERSEEDARVMFGLQEKILSKVNPKSEIRNPKQTTNPKY